MKRLLIMLLCILPVRAIAHPHVFIDTGVELIFNAQNRLAQVKVTWAYDDFYSLLLTQDMGLDLDGDGALTPAETAKLQGFDANWVEGYNGDLEARLGDQLLKLSGPQNPTAKLVMGRIISTHVRDVLGTPEIKGETLSVKVYDPTFYTAYELSRPIKLVGSTGCTFAKIEPDIDAQLAQMQSFLETLDAEADLEENDIPLLGERFATDLQVTCAAS